MGFRISGFPDSHLRFCLGLEWAFLRQVGALIPRFCQNLWDSRDSGRQAELLWVFVQKFCGWFGGLEVLLVHVLN